VTGTNDPNKQVSKDAWNAAHVDTTWTTVTKSLDESVTSNSTPQADDELFFTATSGTMYQFELVIVFASPAGGGTPDLAFNLGEDGTSRGVWGAAYLNTSNTLIYGGPFATSTGSNASAGTATTKRAIAITGTHLGNGGTFRLNWSQFSSNSNATTVYAGSYLRYRSV